MEDYTIALDSGWLLEMPTELMEYASPDAYCYLVFHGQRCGTIRTKDCLFISIAADVPPNIRNDATKQVALHRDRINDTYRYNRNPPKAE